MRTPNDLFDYQKKAVNVQCTHNASALWLDMGLGKTVITLTSIAHLINSQYLRAVLIVAPIRVCRLVWRQEALKWQHTQHLTFNMVMGTKDQRTRALLRKANVYLINYENLKWLAETLETYFIKKNKPLPFDGIVWDEISKMKNSSTNRVKAIMRVLPQIKWKTGLTGTPAANGYADLHGQYLVLDEGQRLGTSKTAFRNRFYFKSGPYKYKPFDTTQSEIETLIGDITLQMAAEDYNPLPDLIVNDIEIELEPDARMKYDQLEKEFFFFLDNGEGVEVFNAASLTNKCLQFSNGAVYPIPGMPMWEPVHDQKLDALEDIIEEANGQQILCAYAYRSDAERIMQRFKSLRPINLTDCKTEASLRGAMARWKDGDCPLMIGHPACLHPGTQVLTEWRGWVRLDEVELTDRVFDGVEYVSHEGCVYSGYKDVITRFDITMTPDHKIKINGEWVEAKDVRDCQEVRRKAIFGREVADSGSSTMPEMRFYLRNDEAECCEAQQIEQGSLFPVLAGPISWFNWNPDLANLVRHEGSRNRYWGNKRFEELSRTWNSNVQGMGRLYEVLRGYARRLLGRFYHRAYRREWSLLQGELPLGVNARAAGEQTKQQSGDIPGRTDALSRDVSSLGIQQDDVNHAIEPRHDRRRGSRGLSELEIRQKYESKERVSQTKAHVYDLVNCGPRHQFLIRNDAGEMYLSHNSMGHGVDGLQSNGHIVVWFGLNWSLDLYEQMNARVRRQGQGVPVICHRIITKDTLDYAQVEALDNKASTQKELRNAIKRYREKKQ